MRSAQELDVELVRLRRNMRRLIVGVTLGTAVGLGVIVTVVGATLAVVDRRATEALMAEPNGTASKTRVADRKADPASHTAAAQNSSAQTTGEAPAQAATAQAPTPAPVQAPLPAVAPATTAPTAPSPQPTAVAATESRQPAAQVAEPAPAKATADDHKKIARVRPDSRADRDASRTDTNHPDAKHAVASRARPETDGAASADAALADPSPAYVTPRDSAVRRGYARVQRGPDTLAPGDDDSEQVTIVSRPAVARPGYARPQPDDGPAIRAADDADRDDRPRDGPFGFLFGGFGNHDN